MRVVIFSADIGEGHDLPARMLRDGILARDPEATVEIRDTLQAAGPVARVLIRDGLETVLARRPWVFDVQYWLIARFAPTRGLLRRLGRLVSARGLLRTVRELTPDVVVATYPGANEVLGALRRSGRLRVPLVSAITDLAALQYWAHAGTDVHLVVHGESSAEVRAVAGPAAQVVQVRGLTDPAFEAPADQAGARRALGLPAQAPLVLVSGGGWGVGDLAGAVQAALGAGEDVHVIALCGHSEAVREALAAGVGADPRVRIMGFTDQMPELLAAVDVLVHSTAGLTVMEALVYGVRVVSYGWGVGHIRVNNEAYRRFGLADVVEDAAALAPVIARALRAPREPDRGYAALPAAADVVLAQARHARA